MIPSPPAEHIRASSFVRTPNFDKYENVEGITVIWLDSHLNISSDCLNMEIRLG
jgi:hypothetical protein